MKVFWFNVYVFSVYFIVTVIGLLALPLFLLINAFYLKEPVPQFMRKLVRLYGFILIKCNHFWASVRVVDKSQGFSLPVIFAANHCSAIDPYLFGLLPYDMAFITSWPFDIPIYKYIMKTCRFIDARKGWEVVREQALALLKEGCSLIVWPEGHRSVDGRLQKFKNGAFKLACLAEVPIVPVCIKGSFEVLRKGRHFLKPHPVEIVLLKPQEPLKEFPELDCTYNLKQRVRNSIAQEIETNGGRLWS